MDEKVKKQYYIQYAKLYGEISYLVGMVNALTEGWATFKIDCFTSRDISKGWTYRDYSPRFEFEFASSGEGWENRYEEATPINVLIESEHIMKNTLKNETDDRVKYSVFLKKLKSIRDFLKKCLSSVESLRLDEVTDWTVETIEYKDRFLDTSGQEDDVAKGLESTV